MKRAIGILLCAAMICALFAGCVATETEPVTEVRVTLPQSTGTRAVVEGEAVLATQLYILSRAYCEKLATVDTESFDADAYSRLVAEAWEAFRITEAFCASFEAHAGVLAEQEENGLEPQENAVYEVLSASSGRSSSLATLAYAAEEISPAVKYAEELTRTFDTAQNGQKLKAVAEKYGTDVKKAKAMLEQAQAILEGAAYTEQAEFENECYMAAVETKAAASNIGFGLSVIATGGTVSGIIEAGGIVCGGLQAIIDTGNAASLHVSNGEGNVYTEYFEKADEILAPFSAVFAIGSGVQNIIDIRDPSKAEKVIDNAAQALLTGVGFVRDYVQEGKVIGVSANIINGYREILVRSADASDSEGVKEVLTKTGVPAEELESTAETQEQTEALADRADACIEEFAELVNPKEPLDTEAFLECVDAVFTERTSAEDFMPETEDTPIVEETDEAEAENTVSAAGNGLSAWDVAGTYYFAELEDSAELYIEAEDDTHLTVTDVGNGEGFSGDYDEASGTFHVVLSDRFSWYVTIVFADTGDGICAELEEGIGDTLITSSSMKIN